jgi:hypothetical protein
VLQVSGENVVVTHVCQHTVPYGQNAEPEEDRS